MTLFGNKVFADVIKIGHIGLGWALALMGGVIVRRGNGMRRKAT